MFCIFGKNNRIIFYTRHDTAIRHHPGPQFPAAFPYRLARESLSPEMEEIEKLWLKEYLKVDARQVPMDIRSRIRFR